MKEDSPRRGPPQRIEGIEIRGWNYRPDLGNRVESASMIPVRNKVPRQPQLINRRGRGAECGGNRSYIRYAEQACRIYALTGKPPIRFPPGWFSLRIPRA